MTTTMPKPATVTLPALVRLNGVEIVHAGERIPASTGPLDITHKDIADIVAASKDPNAPAAVLKIGHNDERFDGQPGYGRLTNFRLSADGSAVLVDIVGVPARLAQLIPSHWPSRSIEMLPGSALKHWGLERFGRVCTAVALLGVSLPAITRLEDVYTHTGQQEEIPAMPNYDLAALGGMAVEEITQRLRDTLQPMSAYIHELVLEDAGLAAIYETPDYQLWQAPVQVANGNVTVGDATKVYRTYAAELSAAPIVIGQTPMNPLEEKLEKLESALTSLVEKLEANTATPDDALDETPEETPESSQEGDSVEDTGNDTTEPDNYAQNADESASSETEYADLVAKLEESNREQKELAADLSVRVQQLEAANRVLTEENKKLSKLQAKQMEEQTASVLLAAVRDGRITPAQREGYAEWAKVDPTGCAHHLSSLTPTNPTMELGYAANPEETEEADTVSSLLAHSPWENN